MSLGTVGAADETIGLDGETIRNNDVDLYRFELTSSGTVGLEVTSDLSNTDDFDSYLRLFDAVGNQIAANDDLSQGNVFSRLDTNLEPGTYYVGVSGYDNISYNPTVAGSGTGGDTGTYIINGSLMPLSAGNNLADNNINSSAVQTIVSGQTLLGNSRRL